MSSPMRATVVDVGSRLLVAWQGGTPAERQQMAVDFVRTFGHGDAYWRKADRCWAVQGCVSERLRAWLAGWVAPEHLTWVNLHGDYQHDRNREMLA